MTPWFAERIAGIDALIEPMLAAARIPGAALAIVVQGQTVLARGYGYSDVGKQRKVAADTLYPIASTSKAMNATLLGQLVDEGRLEWDAPVQTYLPAFRLGDPLMSAQVTVRDLITMRTGLPRHDWLWLDSPWPRAELVSRLRYLDLSKGFREAFQYNNLTATAAGHVAEIICGNSWETLVQERLFEPLSMIDTSCGPIDATRMTCSYHETSDGELKQSEWLATECTAPSGGAIHSTIAGRHLDYSSLPVTLRVVRFSRALTNSRSFARPRSMGWDLRSMRIAPPRLWCSTTISPQISLRPPGVIERVPGRPRSVVLTPAFKPYDPAGPRAPDMAQTVLPTGRTVSYIVRREIGVINRAVYEILFLHEPDQPLSTPWTVPHPGWNGRLVYAFGAGCGAGYSQGILESVDIDGRYYEKLLAQGYALAASTLNQLGTNCNSQLSGETALMVKEHFTESFGEPAFTIGVGASGGAIVYQLAQHYPGLLDGIVPYLSGPGVLSTVIPTFSDCTLLSHAFEKSGLPWTEVQKTAVSGYATWRTCAAQAVEPTLWLDPKACPASLPKELIYDPVSRPKGVRCTYYDNAINVFGRDPRTGFARRTLDNVGIQYGLLAFNIGVIDAEQFIELNRNIGGHDADGAIGAARTVADPQALRIAYEQGLVLNGKNLNDIPIIDWARYTDDRGDFHTLDRAFMTRARLLAAHGTADNQVVLVTRPPGDNVPGADLSDLVSAMARWLSAIAADSGPSPRAVKIVQNKPAELRDGCVAIDGERIFEPADYNGSGRCNRIYPVHGNPRVASGAPISGDILKCALKPVDPSDYRRPLTSEQLGRLKAISPQGVCDYTRPGAGQPLAPGKSDWLNP